MFCAHYEGARSGQILIVYAVWGNDATKDFRCNPVVKSMTIDLLDECYRPFPSRRRISTARLWRCEVCRPIDEIAAELRKTIGRDLTDDKRCRYGLSESVLATKS